MYCMKCGAELPEEANFCTGCGSPVAQSAVAAATKLAEADGPAAASVGPLQEAVDSTRRRSHRRVPLIVMVALVLALMSAVAYAAYYVYTEVYLPQQQAQQAADAVGGDAAGAEAESEYVDVWVVDTETATDDSGTTTTAQYEYDDLGRLTQKTAYEDGGSISSRCLYGYDGDSSRMTTLNAALYLNGEVSLAAQCWETFSYDEDGRLVQCLHNTGGAVSTLAEYAFDESGRLASVVTTAYRGGYAEVGDNLLDSSNTRAISYDSAETNNPSSVEIVAGEDGLGEAQELGFETKSRTYSAEYDERNNLIHAVAEDREYTYTYKLITVKRDEWTPNAYTNPAVGSGSLYEFTALGASSIATLGYAITLSDATVEAILSANE